MSTHYIREYKIRTKVCDGLHMIFAGMSLQQAVVIALESIIVCEFGVLLYRKEGASLIILRSAYLLMSSKAP